MSGLRSIDWLFIYSLISIWVLLLFNVLLTFSGYGYYREISQRKIDIVNAFEYFPTISIMVPAHNEEKVIEQTVRAILKLDYPSDKLELIVINDNSQDRTGAILTTMQQKYPDRSLKIVNTTKENGGRGKSNALNIGFTHSTGEYLVIYDADNTPEAMSLRYLVYSIMNNDKYGAVIGKFRTRNKKRNLLTKFINIETISFQWMSQGGRWRLFGLCTLPGTNFIIRRSILEAVGGWDAKAIAEDTELSIRIYKMGFKISFMPIAVTWEQEPESFRVWTKQRTRWVKGNIYVLNKYVLHPKETAFKSIMIDIYYFFSVYFLFLSSVIVSDIVFLLGALGLVKLSLPGNFFIIWILAYVLFILEIGIALTMEKGESSRENLLIVMLMYFTYCQLWVYVCIKGLLSYTKDKLLKKENKWYKTERF